MNADNTNSAVFFTKDGRLTFYAKQMYLEALLNDHLEELPEDVLNYVETSPETVAELVLMKESTDYKKNYNLKQPNQIRKIYLAQYYQAIAASILIAICGFSIWKFFPDKNNDLAYKKFPGTFEQELVKSDTVDNETYKDELVVKEPKLEPTIASNNLKNSSIEFQVNPQLENLMRGTFRNFGQWRIKYAPDSSNIIQVRESIKIQILSLSKGRLVILRNTGEEVESVTFQDSLNYSSKVNQPGLYYWKLIDENTQNLLKIGRYQCKSNEKTND